MVNADTIPAGRRRSRDFNVLSIVLPATSRVALPFSGDHEMRLAAATWSEHQLLDPPTTGMGSGDPASDQPSAHGSHYMSFPGKSPSGASRRPATPGAAGRGLRASADRPRHPYPGRRIENRNVFRHARRRIGGDADAGSGCVACIPKHYGLDGHRRAPLPTTPLASQWRQACSTPPSASCSGR